MALKTTTPTLSIKVTGVDLSQIQTMTVTIRQGSTTIAKTDDSIEIDDDVLIVTLTQAESARFKDGSANISISATDYGGADVSDSIKVIWAKRGSRTSGSGGSGGGDVDLSNYYNKQEVDAKIKALRDYVDSVISGGGGGTDPDEPDEPSEEKVYNLKDSTSGSNWLTLNALDVRFPVPEDIRSKITRVVVNTCTLTIGNNQNGDSFDIDFRVYGQTATGSTTYKNITYVSQSKNVSTTARKTISNQEVSIGNFESVNYFSLYKAKTTGSGTYSTYSASFDIDLYYSE